MARDNHYVLVVHGTWAAPKGDEQPWYGRYRRKGNFCWELERRLQGTALEGAVWRSQPRDAPYWSWDGENDHVQRLRAADRLAREFERIVDNDPEARLHVVAHSHGGNVLLKCLEGLRTGTEGEVSPAAQRLGKLVFLGAPFYRRIWLRKVAWIESFFNLTAIALSLAVVFGFILYALIALVGIAMALVGEQPVLAAFDPRLWSQAARAGWAIALIAVEASVFFIIRDSLWSERVDSNVYFNELLRPQGEPLPALVVHSGRLDEALLALSSKPLLDIGLRPVADSVVDNLMGRSIMPAEFVQPPAGDSAQLTHGGRSLRRSLVFLLKALSNRAFAWVLDPVNRYLKRRLRTTVLSVMEMAALGLPPNEVRDCRIEVTEVPGLPSLLEVEELYVAPRLVWRSDSKRDSGRRADPDAADDRHPRPVRRRSFEFLWDDDKLEKRLEESQAWPRVREELKRLLDDYEPRVPESFERTLKQSTITLEERRDELMGAVPLDHAAYYEHPDIIDTIAAFLIGAPGPPFGEPPTSQSASSGAGG